MPRVKRRFTELCLGLPGLRVAFKAAGEIMCEEMNATAGFPQVISRRLPRMLTDQTATLVRMATDNALTTILPVVREVQGVSSGVPA